MIEIDLGRFFAVILIAVAVLAAASSAWDRVSEHRNAKRVRRHAVRCRICGAVSRRTERGALQPCPECGSATWVGRDRRLG